MAAQALPTAAGQWLIAASTRAVSSVVMWLRGCVLRWARPFGSGDDKGGKVAVGHAFAATLGW